MSRHRLRLVRGACCALLMLLVATAVSSAATLQLGEALVNSDASALFPSFPLLSPGGLPGEFSEFVASHTMTSTGGLNVQIFSAVYRNPATQYLAFVYMFDNVTAAVDMEHANIGGSDGCSWLDTVVAGGSNGLGNSTAVPGFLGWSDGDPIMLGLTPTGALAMDFGIGTAIGTMIQPSGWSALVWVATESLSYRLTDVVVQDGSKNGQGEALGPVDAPEPSSLALLGLGAGMVGLIVRRRRQS